MAETTPTFIQLKNAAGTPIFPKVDLRNVQGELSVDNISGLSDYATTSAVETAFSEYTTDVVDKRIAAAVGNIEQFGKVIVPRTAEQSIEAALDAVENPKDNAIYLVPLMAGDLGYEESNGIHVEYLYVSDKWEPIGSTKTNLDDYYTKSEVGTLAKDAEGKTESVIEDSKLNEAYAPTLKFQGNEVGKLFNSLNIIGIGNVSVDENGNVTLRLGENLNCSLWNGTDGISKATVTGALSTNFKKGSWTVSSDYSAVSAYGSRNVYAASQTLTAKAGTSQTTAAGAMSNNGNEVHFDNVAAVKDSSGAVTNYTSTDYFVVSFLEGTNTAATTYLVGPIGPGMNATTTSKTYNAVKAVFETSADGKTKLLKSKETTENTGISCAVAAFGSEPKSANGATGFSGTVNFTITPSTLYGASTDFKLVSIDQISIDSENIVKEVAKWAASDAVDDVYFYLKENTKPSNPTSASYACDSVTTKVISGVTYITTASKFHAEATGMANIGYPANSGNKATVASSGTTTWTAGVTDKNSSNFTTWSDKKDVSMAYKSSQFSPNIGDHSDPAVTVVGTNALGSSAEAAKSATGTKLLVCDDNGYISSSPGSFAAKDTWAAGEFMIYDGCLVYPTKNFDGYNKLGVTDAPTSQPNYSNTTGDCEYVQEFEVGADLPNCTVTVGHRKSIKTALTSGDLKIEIYTGADVFKDIGNGSISKVAYGDTSTSMAVTFDPADKLQKGKPTKVRITMSSAVAEIKSITFA